MAMTWGMLMLLAVAGAVLLLPAAAAWIVLRRKPDAPDGGRCGKCGYSVRGLTTLACPECGADLREAGIVTASRRGGGVFGVIAGLWLTFVTIVGATVAVVIHAAAAMSTQAMPRSGKVSVLLTFAVAIAAGVGGLAWAKSKLKAAWGSVLTALVLWALVLGALLLLTIRL